MYLGTHFCLPVIAVGTFDLLRLANKKKPIIENKQIYPIGLAGILPDILWPHTSIHARLTSWTHTVWFLAILIPIVFIISKLILKKNYGLFAGLFWISAVLHVVVDMISGGVSLLYPIKIVIGSYYIAWPNWKYSELIFIGSAIPILITRYVMIKKMNEIKLAK